MNVRLAGICARAWALGLLGMGVAKTFFDVGPGRAAFDACAGAWLVGGLTYCLLGVLSLTDAQRSGSEG